MRKIIITVGKDVADEDCLSCRFSDVSPEWCSLFDKLLQTHDKRIMPCAECLSATVEEKQ